jgi:protein-disulfide isomerase/uncharacterized membrane protein
MTVSPALPLDKPRTLLAVAAGLGFASALWALFQWAELLLARTGQSPFCSVNETLNCQAVWDSPFAIAVHNATQIPIAGWGLIWGVTAGVLALWALAHPPMLDRGLSAALRITAIVGVVSSIIFFGASIAAGALCLTCITTYVVVVAFAVITMMATKSTGFLHVQTGIVAAGALVFASFLALLYPGMKTPHANATAMALPTGGSAAATPTPKPDGAKPAAAGNDVLDGPGTGDSARDDLIRRVVESFDAQSKQVIADLLFAYKIAEQKTVPPPRSFAIGSGNEAVRISEWTDPLCPHCARLHETLAGIRQEVAPGLFSVDAHQYPLDAVCNKDVQRKSEDGYRCIASKAALCVEKSKEAFEAGGALFAIMEEPDVKKLPDLLAKYIDKKALQACIDDSATAKALDDDIAEATARGLEGTPLVVLNGKQVPPVPPLLYLLVLTGGKAQHPAFGLLPPPKPPQPHDHNH